MPTEPETVPDPCLLEKVGKLMDAEPQLEAVEFGPGGSDVRIATLGSGDHAALERRVSEALTTGREECGALAETAVCHACGDVRAVKVGLGREVRPLPGGGVAVRRIVCPTAPSFWRWARLPTFVTRDVQPIVEHEHALAEEEWKHLALLAGICFAGMMGGYAAGWLHAPGWVAHVLFGVAFIAGGWDAAIETWEHLRRRSLDVHFLMLAVAAGAASVGAWGEGALLLFLFSASGAMEHYAMGRTRREIGALLKGAPKTATLVEGDHEREVPVAELVRGMRVRVTPGEQIPVDLDIDQGESACDESNLTGESIPVPKRAGDQALGGTLNVWGVLEGVVARPASESALTKIIRLIEDAQHLRAPSQRFTDKFGTGYTYAILGLCASMFFVWWLGFGMPAFASSPEHRSAFYRAMTLLVVASPCALVLSVPSGILSAIAFGARRGVLFRGGTAIETLAEIRAVAMDKTGTLTSGELTLAGFETLEGDSRAAETAAWNMARLSEHPLSRAIKRLGGTWKSPLLAVEGMESVAGKGTRARVAGIPHVLGNAAFVGAELGRTLPKFSGPIESAEVYVGGPGLLARLRFQDHLRPEARGLLAELRALGVETVMLTGDRREVAERVAAEAGIASVQAELLPEGKVAAVQKLKADGRKVAMIGDGVNDAPVLAAADVGVAMGARGSDAALEQAEVVLMNDRIENFLLAYRLSLRARRVIRQNIFIALGTVLVMVGTALGMPLPLALGVAAHEGSTVVVVLNSLRLLFGKGR
jgi:Cd2+/Zn2+-exporting ATPase